MFGLVAGAGEGDSIYARHDVWGPRDGPGGCKKHRRVLVGTKTATGPECCSPLNGPFTPKTL